MNHGHKRPVLSQCFAVVFFIMSMAGAVPPVTAETDPWYEAVEQADARIQAFEAAAARGDADAMRRTALELQADPIAVKRFNKNSTDNFRTLHNEVTASIQQRTRQVLRENLAQELGVRPEQITTFEATNPPKPGDPVKVGQDWDITVRVDGTDVHHSMSAQHVHNAYYEAVHGTSPPSAQAASELAHRQALEVTSYQHPEAYGGSQTEGGRIIGDPAGSPELRDPEQLGNTIEYKSRLPGNEAARLEAEGRFVEAQGLRMEQARQAAKQFDRQVKVRITAMGGTIPPHVENAMDILRRIGDGDITPTQGQRLLAEMGETIDSAASKSAGLIESAQTLRRGGLGAADDVFVENARNRLRQKGIDPDALRPPADLQLEDLRGAGGKAARSWVRSAMGVLEAVGWAADFYELSMATREYLSLLEKAMDPNTSDEEAAALFAKMEAAGMRIAALGGLGALFEAYPPAAAVFGVYTITRLGLENTETGQRIDAAALNLIDRHVQAAERAACDMAEFVGMENTCADLEDQERDLLLAYLRALREGRIKLKEPFTAKDLGDMVLNGVPVDDIIVRVDELERLTAANERYGDALEKLKALQARCGVLAEKRGSKTAFLDESAGLAANANERINELQEILIDSGDAAEACKLAPDMRAGIVAAADSVITQAKTAVDAHSGAISRLQACRSRQDMDSARRLTDMGLAVAAGAAGKYMHAQEGYDRLEVVLTGINDATATLDQAGNTLDTIRVNRKTAQNKLDVAESLIGQVQSLESSCSAEAKAIVAEARALVPILGEQAKILAAGAGEIQSQAAAVRVDGEQEKLAGIKQDLRVVGSRADTLAAGLRGLKGLLAACRDMDLPVAYMLSINTAMDAVPDTKQWSEQVSELSLNCKTRLAASDDDESPQSADEDDDRGDYDYDEDESNISPERVAERNTPVQIPTIGAGIDEDDGEQQIAQAGAPIDPTYRDDPIAEAEREEERAENAERVAAAGNPWRGDREEDNPIAGEFGDPPDPDDIPDADGNRDRDIGRDRDRGRDQESNDEPPVESGPDVPEDERPPPAESETGDEIPAPPVEEGDDPATAEGEIHCRRLVQRLESQGNQYINLVNRFTAAARAEDEDAARRYGCQVLEASEDFSSLFDEYIAERCPLEGDVEGFHELMDQGRQAVRNARIENCGDSGAPAPAVAQFAGRWGQRGCDPGGDAAYRWLVNLEQEGDRVTGYISFHRCPGGGRASYRVSGTATASNQVTLEGSLSSSRGPLSETARSQIRFTVSNGQPPVPNLAR